MLRLAVSISRPGCYELQSDCPHELLLAHVEGREVQGGHGRRALPQFTLVPSTPC